MSWAAEVIGSGIVVANITDGTEAEKAVRLQAQLLDAVGQAVIAADLAGVVVYWNRTAEQMYGWSKFDAVGRRLGDLISTEETA